MARQADPERAAARRVLSAWMRRAMQAKRINAKVVALAIGETEFVTRSWASGRFGPPEGERLRRLEEFLGSRFDPEVKSDRETLTSSSLDSLDMMLEAVRQIISERLELDRARVRVTITIDPKTSGE